MTTGRINQVTIVHAGEGPPQRLAPRTRPGGREIFVTDFVPREERKKRKQKTRGLFFSLSFSFQEAHQRQPPRRRAAGNHLLASAIPF